MNLYSDPPDRRAAQRMSIERDVAVRVLHSKQPETEMRGKTVNISSSGVLFTTDRALILGRRLEISIDWPVKLNEKCALKLVARGRVVRFEGDRAALEILQHEFRTRSNPHH
jgi:c-di-GMP-binding flagellar brake protein YcgR